MYESSSAESSSAEHRPPPHPPPITRHTHPRPPLARQPQALLIFQNVLPIQAAGGRTFSDAGPRIWRSSANGITMYSPTAVLHVEPSGCMLSLRHVRSESGEGLFVGPWMGMCSAPKGVRRVRCKATDFTLDSFLRLLSGPISPIFSFLRCFYRPHKPDPKKVTKRYEKVTKELRKVTKSYEQLRTSYV